MNQRVLVSLEDVTLSFGGKPVLQELSVHIGERDRICLVGKNGAGKTTLMRLIMRELELDAGRRFAHPGIRIGYLEQSVRFNPEDSVMRFVLSGLPDGQGGEESTHLAEIVLAPLDVQPQALMGSLSGGQLRRAALARALVSEPDVLLLDEPTNHLDLSAIEWLERYLRNYRGAFLCVSHDRAFLAAVSEKIFWIDRGKVRVHMQGYAHFDAWAEALIEQEARELHNMQKKLEAEVGWTQGGVSGRRKRNQRRLSELHRLREKIKNEKAAQKKRNQTIDIDPLERVQASKIIAEFKGVSKSFVRDGAKLPILENFDVRILRGDRIGILGKNGSGKSTFLKLLTGEMEPDAGRVFRGKTVEFAYFDQNRSQLDPSKTLWDTLCPQGGSHVFLGSGEEKRPVHVCGYLKQFLFDPKIAREKVSTLSGGQQNRLMLAKTLVNPGNVLILDEPTNDLDMDTLDMLTDVLADYPGTLILVSHDRDFLDRTVTEVLAFEGNCVVEHAFGGYSDYVAAKKQRSQLQAVCAGDAPKAGGSGKNGLEKTEAGKTKGKGGKMSFKLKHELENLPATIDRLEKEIAALRLTLSDPRLYTTDPALFDTASLRFARAETELAAAEHRWLELEELQQHVQNG